MVRELNGIPDLKVQSVNLSQQQLQNIALETAHRLAQEAAGRGERVGDLAEHPRTAPFIRVASGRVQF